MELPGPLDDHLVKLKHKYATLEQEMQSKNQMLQEQVHDLKRDLDESQQDRAEANTLTRELEKHIEELTTRLEGGGDELVKQMALMETRMVMAKDDAAAQRKEVELMRSKVLAARVEREEEFTELSNSFAAAREAQKIAEADSARRLEEMKSHELKRISQDEELQLLEEQEEARKAAMKDIHDKNCNLELELRQVTAERDHARASIAKLEADHRKACEDCAKADKKGFELNREVRDLKQQLSVAARAREDQAADHVDTREKMLRAVADQEVAGAEKNRLATKLEELQHEMLTMKHERRMWIEEKELISKEQEGHGARVSGTEEACGQLRSELSLAKEALSKRADQVQALRAELKRMKEVKIKLDAELASAQDKLLLASELDDLKMEEFITMRNSNLEVAKKIERFMEKTSKARVAVQDTLLDDKDDPLLND
eukprot:TRINITY_DN13910_c0_g1_i4.p1 TRINITY_DN13910_c0_g1~~TRINITY_DN13910_c0_g1_i4.p1  ORF type:complete len:431 (+),score=144.38 TRINITY_DN13910_c0_g1_i4:377-1669(+)